MSFSVVWLEEAEEDFVQLWISAVDSSAFARAGTEVHRLLTSNPLEAGESREEGQRILFVPPLGLRFDVRLQDKLVVITAVWSIRRKPS